MDILRCINSTCLPLSNGCRSRQNPRARNAWPISLDHDKLLQETTWLMVCSWSWSRSLDTIGIVYIIWYSEILNDITSQSLSSQAMTLQLSLQSCFYQLPERSQGPLLEVGWPYQTFCSGNGWRHNSTTMYVSIETLAQAFSASIPSQTPVERIDITSFRHQAASCISSRECELQSKDIMMMYYHVFSEWTQYDFQIRRAWFVCVQKTSCKGVKRSLISKQPLQKPLRWQKVWPNICIWLLDCMLTDICIGVFLQAKLIIPGLRAMWTFMSWCWLLCTVKMKVVYSIPVAYQHALACFVHFAQFAWLETHHSDLPTAVQIFMFKGTEPLI